MRTWICFCVFALGLLASPPSHAIWGLFGKIGSAAGKTGAGTAAKTGAAGVATVEGTEAAAAAARAAKTADSFHPAPTSAEQISAMSGLGKAVPAEVEALLYGGGRTLAQVPDRGVREWLQMPFQKPAQSQFPTPSQTSVQSSLKGSQTEKHATDMVQDYLRLLEGKPALGPSPKGTPKAASKAEAKLPQTKPAKEPPWYGVELLLRAAHLGHVGARQEAERLCKEQSASKRPLPEHCKRPNAIAHGKAP